MTMATDILEIRVLKEDGTELIAKSFTRIGGTVSRCSQCGASLYLQAMLAVNMSVARNHPKIQYFCDENHAKAWMILHGKLWEPPGDDDH